MLTDQEIDELESASTVGTDILIAKAKFNFIAKSDRELSFNKVSCHIMYVHVHVPTLSSSIG